VGGIDGGNRIVGTGIGHRPQGAACGRIDHVDPALAGTQVPLATDEQTRVPVYGFTIVLCCL